MTGEGITLSASCPRYILLFIVTSELAISPEQCYKQFL